MFLLASGEPHQAGSHLRAVTQGHWPLLVTQQHKLLLLPSLIQEVPAMVSSFVEHNTEISEMEHCKQQFQHALERLNVLLVLWETIIQKMDILSKGKEIVPLLAKVVLICTVSSPLVTLNYRLAQPQYCALEWFVLPWSSVTIAHLLRTQQSDPRVTEQQYAQSMHSWDGSAPQAPIPASQQGGLTACGCPWLKQARHDLSQGMQPSIYEYFLSLSKHRVLIRPHHSLL